MIEHLINNRVLTTLNPSEKELKLQAHKNYLFPLCYLGVLDIHGDKAQHFLQGQLTCDINSVSERQIAQGAQCNLKGRILTLMDIIAWQGIKIILPKDLQEATISSLSKTAMLSHVSIKANKELFVFGFYLQNHEDLFPNNHSFSDSIYSLTHNTHSCCYHLGYGFYIIVADNDLANNIQKAFVEKDQLLGSLTWHTLRLNYQQIDIYPESRGLFLPHRLDLQQTPYLSFNKGCYKGQEIIARMQYKAISKHQMQINEIKTNQKIYSGQKLLNKSEGTELGELIDFSIINSDHYLIAISILKEAGETIFFEGHSESIKLNKPK